MPMVVKEPIPLCACSSCLASQPERASVKSYNRKIMIRMLCETKSERTSRLQEQRAVREASE